MFKELLTATYPVIPQQPITHLMSLQPKAHPHNQIVSGRFLASLKFPTGEITLPGSIATLDFTRSRVVSVSVAARRQACLVDAWGNPPGSRPWVY